MLKENGKYLIKTELEKTVKMRMKIKIDLVGKKSGVSKSARKT